MIQEHQEHEAARELIAAVALGAATREETTFVEAHAESCPVCREELLGLREGADQLALAVPTVKPSRGLRRSLVATVRAEAALTDDDGPRSPLRAWLAALRPWPTVAGVAVSLALLLAGWNVALQTREAPTPEPLAAVADEVVARSVSGTGAAPGVEGRLLYLPNEDRAILELSGLEAPAAGHGYELWVMDGGTARSAGFLSLEGPPGEPRLLTGVASRVRDADALAVTLEETDNTAVPTTPELVSVALSA